MSAGFGDRLVASLSVDEQKLLGIVSMTNMRGMVFLDYQGDGSFPGMPPCPLHIRVSGPAESFTVGQLLVSLRKQVEDLSRECPPDRN